jgi:uncharacterized protein (DUF433 family)
MQMSKALKGRIVIRPAILGGKPVIQGTRISVEFILSLLSSGMSVEDILADYRHLTREDILAALHYAENLVKHEEVLLPSQIASTP